MLPLVVSLNIVLALFQLLLLHVAFLHLPLFLRFLLKVASLHLGLSFQALFLQVLLQVLS